MPGAALLCVESALRMGVGYVYLDSAKSVCQDPRLSSAVIPYNDQTKLIPEFSAVVIGPGCGRKIVDQKGLKEKVKKILNLETPVLLDADALWWLAKNPQKLPSHWIISPHEGEAGRLLGVQSQNIQADRLGSALRLQKKFGCVVLLKGYRSLLVNSLGEVFQITSGDVTLAKAGTGDVLSGMMGSLLAQGMPSDVAVALGTYIHGRMSLKWKQKGHHVFTLEASDLLALIEEVIADLDS